MNRTETRPLRFRSLLGTIGSLAQRLPCICQPGLWWDPEPREGARLGRWAPSAMNLKRAALSR